VSGVTHKLESAERNKSGTAQQSNRAGLNHQLEIAKEGTSQGAKGKRVSEGYLLPCERKGGKQVRTAKYIERERDSQPGMHRKKVRSGQRKEASK
jgi:hypothetical protein